MMLYAGIRPHEVERLTWESVDVQEECICVRPQHSKTGGARRVTILAPLASLLRNQLLDTQRKGMPRAGKICPRNWRSHWAKLHKAAGFPRWQPDVLRHTYASHHLARFRSFSELQVEMGHRSSELLRSRYVSMPRKSLFC